MQAKIQGNFAKDKDINSFDSFSLIGYYTIVDGVVNLKFDEGSVFDNAQRINKIEKEKLLNEPFIDAVYGNEDKFNIVALSCGSNLELIKGKISKLLSNAKYTFAKV